MGKHRKWIQIVVLSAILLAGGFAIGTSFGNEDIPVEIGGKAPGFTILGLDEQLHALSDLKGKAVVLNFWGTFCPPCVEEMPALQRQYEKWNESGVVVLGINLNESRATVNNFVKNNKITFPILLDNDTTRKAYKVRNYPTTFFIDANGVIKNIFVGGMQESFIQSQIQKLLESN